jgi:hypothetical protein
VPGRCWPPFRARSVDRVGTEATAPHLTLADLDPERRRAIDPVDLEQVDATDRPPILEQADHEPEELIALIRPRVLVPFLARGQAAWRITVQPSESDVLMPAMDELDVLGFDRSQEDTLASDRLPLEPARHEGSD